MSVPTTGAGGWLLDHWGLANHPSGDAIQPDDAIVAIEAEAMEQANADRRTLRAALDALVEAAGPAWVALESCRNAGLVSDAEAEASDALSAALARAKEATDE